MDNPLPSDNRTEKLLCSQVEAIIAETLRYRWLQGMARPRVSVEHFAEEDGTEAIILHADVFMRIAVKVHLPLGGKQEEEGYRILCDGPEVFKQHLLAPLLPDVSQLVWLAPYVNADTLHALTCGMVVTADDEADIFQLYADFLRVMKELWRETRTPAPNRLLQSHYIDRIGERKSLLAEALNVRSMRDLNRVPIVVNNKMVGTIGEVLGNFTARVRGTHAKHACLTHGDEHAKNIMVYRDEARGGQDGQIRWVLIDYTHANKHGDWVFSIARMLYWWRLYSVLEMAKKDGGLQDALQVTWQPSRNGLIINYDSDALSAAIPPVCRALDRQVMEYAETVAAEFEEAEQVWRERLNLAFFAAVFAASIRHFHRQLPGAEFTVPIMIGESVNALFGKGALHSTDDNTK